MISVYYKCITWAIRRELFKMSLSQTDEALSEALLLQQEVIRLDARLKQYLAHFEDCKDEASLVRQTRSARERMSELQKTIDRLALTAQRMSSRSDRQSVLSQVSDHKKELEESKKDLANVAQKTRKAIERNNRQGLLEGGEGEAVLRRRKREEDEVTRKSEESGERLTLLIERMAMRVGQSEDGIINLVRSSETLGKTHDEYGNQAAHIQTGNKLLSKWERRELTDKILVVIALLFYFAAIYYVLNKRVFSKFWFW